LEALTVALGKGGKDECLDQKFRSRRERTTRDEKATRRKEPLRFVPERKGSHQKICNKLTDEERNGDKKKQEQQKKKVKPGTPKLGRGAHRISSTTWEGGGRYQVHLEGTEGCKSVEKGRSRTFLSWGDDTERTGEKDKTWRHDS